MLCSKFVAFSFQNGLLLRELSESEVLSAVKQQIGSYSRRSQFHRLEQHLSCSNWGTCEIAVVRRDLPHASDYAKRGGSVVSGLRQVCWANGKALGLTIQPTGLRVTADQKGLF